MSDTSADAVADMVTARSSSGSLTRIFAWTIVVSTFVFLLNNYLTNWRSWPGATGFLSGDFSALGLTQAALYLAGLAGVIAYVTSTKEQGLRPDSKKMYALVNFIIRAAFWAVLLVGVVDAAISFMRVEGMLPGLFGPEFAAAMDKSTVRGFYVHIPLILFAILLAFVFRGLGFPWLAFLVVVAELMIVITRFIFSYEQAFMGDLVRFWYAALFLFASAYTLFEDGHVRVDVFYSALEDRTKGIVNAVGAVLLGMSLCAVVMAFGMSSKAAIINSPLLAFETTQTGFGMYVKYLMAGFLGVFAVSMMVQFTGAFLESMADWRGEAGKREIAPPSAH